ncbi:MAG: Xenobiotic-transporting ATPase [Planctomycetaceae bacterium]|nr:Xenobiotic-transporting ATPase [Planctomycetaceae bacterium]
MSTREPKIFDRVFSNRELFRGRALRANLWSLVAAVALVKMLVIAFLTVELCLVVGEGQPVRISADVFKQFFGVEATTSVADSKMAEIPPGFAQVAWRSRHQIFGKGLAFLTRRVFGVDYGLSPQVTCLVLILTGSGFWLITWLCLKLARRQRTQLELETVGQLRSHLHRQALRLGPADLQRADTAQVLGLFKDEIGQLRDTLCYWLSAWTGEPARISLLVLLALVIDAKVSFYCGVPLLFGWLIHEHRRRELIQAHKLAVAHAQDELRLLSESLTRSRLVRGYGMEQAAQEHFKKYLDRYQADVNNLERRRGALSRLEGIIVWLCGVIVLSLVGVELTTPTEHFSVAAALILAVWFAGIGYSIRNWQNAFEAREDAVPAAMRVFRYLDRIPEVGQAVGAKFLQPLTRSIEFMDVTYVTSDKTTLLDQLSLSIPAQRQVAIISTDSRGALALVSLLPRFIDPQAGQVLIDGEDIAWVTLESLRAEILVAGGPDVVFTGTVQENIAAGQAESSLSEIMDAAKVTHAQHFIARLPHGYETVIGEHGEALDVGQSFRLALARALLRDPALLIIEEPAEALDEDTKSLIDDAYQRIAAKRTVIYLPNRLATLRRCDEIILLHQGQIAARGTHVNLVKTSQLYRHWEYVRFNEFRHVVDG